MKTNKVKIEFSGPPASGKTLTLTLVKDFLAEAGVDTYIHDEPDYIEFDPLSRDQIQKLVSLISK